MISRDSQEAMYEQIANILRTEIAQKKYPPGGAIGTHDTLSQRFGVSLITVRKALDVLLSEGLLVSKKGKGTFVAQSPVQDGFNRLTGMSTVIAMNNLVASVTVQGMQFIKTPERFAEDVKTGLGDHCLFIERTHETDRGVIGFASIYLPQRYADRFSIVDVSDHTIYHLFENKLGIPLGKGVQQIRAGEASAKAAGILRIPKKRPVLLIDRKSYSRDGEFLEYMEICYEAGQYSFQVELDLFAEEKAL